MDINEIASMIAVSEYGDGPMSRDPKVLKRLRDIARNVILRARVEALVHVRMNLEAFAITQGYEPGEDSISFEMVFQYLDYEADKTIGELGEGSE